MKPKPVTLTRAHSCLHVFCISCGTLFLIALCINL